MALLRGPSIDVRPPAPPARPLGHPEGDDGSPQALRPSRSRWRDPRLAVGVALVAVCALLGSRLLGGADDTVGVWVARAPLNEGQQLAAGDVVRRQVRFAGQADADRYLSADAALPGGRTLDRAVGEGELLPRGSLRSTGPGSVTELPLSVNADAVPDTLHAGSVVDVWVTPRTAASDAAATGRSASPRAKRVLDDVPVVSAPRTGTSLGPTATRQVIVGVDADQEPGLAASIAVLAGGDAVLTLQR